MTSYLEVISSQLDCRKKKQGTKGYQEYRIFETENNWQLYQELKNQTYEISPSDAFIVSYPVIREVFAGQYRDRIVHHLIMNRKEERFEQRFIKSSYSCRKGKSTLYGIHDAYNQISIASEGFTKEVFIVKCDLTACFMNIDKDILMNMLGPYIADTWEDWLFRKIIFNRPQDYCIFKSPRSKWNPLPPGKSLFGTNGMPIGNLTSQILVNFYLTAFDLWCLGYANILGYGRYVDDFFAIFATKGEADQFILDCQPELSKINMKLNLKKTKVFSSDYGIEFIGSYIKPNRIYATKRTVTKFNQFLYDHRHSDIKEFYAALNSYLGYLSQFSAHHLKRNLLIKVPNIRRYGYFDECLKKFTPYMEYQDKVGCHKSKISVQSNDDSSI